MVRSTRSNSAEESGGCKGRGGAWGYGDGRAGVEQVGDVLAKLGGGSRVVEPA